MAVWSKIREGSIANVKLRLRNIVCVNATIMWTKYVKNFASATFPPVILKWKFYVKTFDWFRIRRVTFFILAAWNLLTVKLANSSWWLSKLRNRKMLNNTMTNFRSSSEDSVALSTGRLVRGLLCQSDRLAPQCCALATGELERRSSSASVSEAQLNR